MNIHTRARTLLDAASAASRPVWAFLIIEAAVILGLGGFAAVLGTDLARLVAFDGLPPWWVVAVLPMVSAMAQLVRATRPIVAARRWHGVLLRRIDERWGDER
jgi:hypothetical protein